MKRYPKKFNYPITLGMKFMFSRKKGKLQRKDRGGNSDGSDEYDLPNTQSLSKTHTLVALIWKS